MKWNKPVQTIQAKFDRIINGETVRVAAVFPVDCVDGEFKIVDPQEATDQSILVGFFPGLMMMSPNGKVSLVPLNSEAVRGKDGDRAEWVNGTWTAMAETQVLGQKALHHIYGKVGNWRAPNGGFVCRAADLERGGDGKLEQLMFDAVQAVAAQVWAHGETFECADEVALQQAIGTFSHFLGQAIRLDVKEEARVNQVIWRNEDGTTRQLQSGSETRKAAYQQKRDTAGTTRQGGGSAADRIQATRERLNIGRPQVQDEAEDKVRNG